LLGYAYLGLAVIGVEAVVVAVGTASNALGPVPVGASEPGVQGDLLHALAKMAPDERAVIVVSLLSYELSHY